MGVEGWKEVWKEQKKSVTLHTWPSNTYVASPTSTSCNISLEEGVALGALDQT